LPSGAGNNQKGTIGGTDEKPFLFHYTASKEAGIHKIFFSAIGISSH
jgi:hypothetical protein